MEKRGKKSASGTKAASQTAGLKTVGENRVASPEMLPKNEPQKAAKKPADAGNLPSFMQPTTNSAMRQRSMKERAKFEHKPVVIPKTKKKRKDGSQKNKKKVIRMPSSFKGVKRSASSKSMTAKKSLKRRDSVKMLRKALSRGREEGIEVIIRSRTSLASIEEGQEGSKRSPSPIGAGTLSDEPPTKLLEHRSSSAGNRMGALMSSSGDAVEKLLQEPMGPGFGQDISESDDDDGCQSPNALGSSPHAGSSMLMRSQNVRERTMDAHCKEELLGSEVEGQGVDLDNSSHKKVEILEADGNNSDVELRSTIDSSLNEQSPAGGTVTHAEDMDAQSHSLQLAPSGFGSLLLTSSVEVDLQHQGSRNESPADQQGIEDLHEEDIGLNNNFKASSNMLAAIPSLNENIIDSDKAHAGEANSMDNIPNLEGQETKLYPLNPSLDSPFADELDLQRTGELQDHESFHGADNTPAAGPEADETLAHVSQKISISDDISNRAPSPFSEGHDAPRVVHITSDPLLEKVISSELSSASSQDQAEDGTSTMHEIPDSTWALEEPAPNLENNPSPEEKDLYTINHTFHSDEPSIQQVDSTITGVVQDCSVASKYDLEQKHNVIVYDENTGLDNNAPTCEVDAGATFVEETPGSDNDTKKEDLIENANVDTGLHKGKDNIPEDREDSEPYSLASVKEANDVNIMLPSNQEQGGIVSLSRSQTSDEVEIEGTPEEIAEASLDGLGSPTEANAQDTNHTMDCGLTDTARDQVPNAEVEIERREKSTINPVHGDDLHLPQTAQDPLHEDEVIFTEAGASVELAMRQDERKLACNSIHHLEGAGDSPIMQAQENVIESQSTECNKVFLSIEEQTVDLDAPLNQQTGETGDGLTTIATDHNPATEERIKHVEESMQHERDVSSGVLDTRSGIMSSHTAETYSSEFLAVKNSSFEAKEPESEVVEPREATNVPSVNQRSREISFPITVQRRSQRSEESSKGFWWELGVGIVAGVLTAAWMAFSRGCDGCHDDNLNDIELEPLIEAAAPQSADPTFQAPNLSEPVPAPEMLMPAPMPAPQPVIRKGARVDDLQENFLWHSE